jgi:hypothetical protein
LIKPNRLGNAPVVDPEKARLRADPEDTETVELLDAFDEALDDPEFKQELLNRITD